MNKLNEFQKYSKNINWFSFILISFFSISSWVCSNGELFVFLDLFLIFKINILKKLFGVNYQHLLIIYRKNGALHQF